MSDGERAAIAARVTKIIKRSLPKRAAAQAITPEQNLRSDLNIDSMGLLTLTFRMEEEFGIDVATHTQAIGQIKTVGDIVTFVSEISHATQ